MLWWIKRNALSLVIGAVIGCLAGCCHSMSTEIEAAKTGPSSVKEVVVIETLYEKREPIIPEAPVEDPEVEESTPEAPAYDPEIPSEIQDAAWLYGAEYGLSPEFLTAVAFNESSYNPLAKNGGCVGLMQVSLKWHRDRMERLEVTEEEMWTVDGSMHVAADYLAELNGRYNDLAAVLFAYNGDSRLSDYLSTGEIKSGYVRAVLDLTKELEEKHKGGDGLECVEHCQDNVAQEN